ncbi:hypothetical protein BKA61DRAFT_729128 [Leptodontidium sp. MPI-SDFR-AT-0119]|nr:hypothetical protein BKA61DRAFT_729128 [Leptodontidium sp. MPI-SDFR-AT-0119]
MSAVEAEWKRLIESSPRLKAVLHDVFQELVQYFLGIFKIFYHPDGRSKNGLRGFAKSVWKPFRFDDTLARLAMYRERVLPEIALLNLKISSNVKSMVKSSQVKVMEEAIEANSRNATIVGSLDKIDEKAERESHCRPNLTVVSASGFAHLRSLTDTMTPLHNALEEPLVGFSNIRLISLGYKASRSLMVWRRTCNAGPGKTVLAASMVQDPKQDEVKTPICYHFFNSTQKIAANDSATAYRALLSQIFQYNIDDERLNELFRFAMIFQATGQRKTRIVIDALDECDDIAELVSKLHRIGSLDTIQLALFSRPTITILSRDVPSLETLAIGWLNIGDINLYLFRALEVMKSERLLSASLESKGVAETLTRRADGMFLWARLMVVYLKSPGLYPGEHQKAISELDSPEGLDVMYERILHLIERGRKSLHRLASSSFLWILYGKRPMMPAELENALIPSDMVVDNKESWQLPDFEDTVILACGGLVEQSPRVITLSGGTFHPFRFTHASVRGFIVSQAILRDSASAIRNQILPPPIDVAEAYLVSTCLKYLMYRVPAQPLSGKIGTNVSPQDIWAAFPFSNYAMLNRTSHLAATGQTHAIQDGKAAANDAHEILCSTLEKFLAQPKETAWVFGEYFEKLENDWGQSLHKSPAIIWEEVVAFTPSPLLLKHKGISVKCLRPSPPSEAGLWNLSIFSRKKFERHSKRVNTAKQVFEDRSLSSGWLFRYEILQINDQRVVASLEILLPEFEVTIYHIRNVSDRLVCVSSRLPIEPILGVSLKVSGGKVEAVEKKRSEITYKDTGRFRNNGRQNTQLHWIYLDNSGENLCYATQERPLPNSLKVFRISICTDETLRLETQLVAERSFWTHDITYTPGEEGRDFEMCFHPFLPIVVYAWVKGTYVWNIDTKKCVKAGHGSLNISSLTCSKTGSSCILSPRDQRPEIISIVQAMKDTGITDISPLGVVGEIESTNPVLKQEASTIDSTPDPSQISTKPWTLAHAILGPQKVMSSSIVTIAPNGSFNHISVLNVGRSAVLNQWRDDGEDNSMTLSRVPNWVGAESANPSVILPS